MCGDIVCAVIQTAGCSNHVRATGNFFIAAETATGVDHALVRYQTPRISDALFTALNTVPKRGIRQRNGIRWLPSGRYHRLRLCHTDMSRAFSYINDVVFARQEPSIFAQKQRTAGSYDQQGGPERSFSNQAAHDRRLSCGRLCQCRGYCLTRTAQNTGRDPVVITAFSITLAHRLSLASRQSSCPLRRSARR